MDNKFKKVIGIDEVGRGPLAGPVYVCGVIMSEKTYKKLIASKKFHGLRDSKKLSEKNRDLWFAKIKDWEKGGLLKYFCLSKSSDVIDKIGISKSIKQIIKQILIRANVKKDSKIYLDGSLSAPSEYLNQKTIIKGDEKIPIISLASIVAKVLRDKKMKILSIKFNQYEFDVNKGYGTKKHINQIKNIGLSKIHRKTYCKNFIK